MKPIVAIAGATTTIGRWFMQTYREEYEFIALSRKQAQSPHSDPNVVWKQADLYSLSSTEAALEGADYALYLVHSMRPSTRLNQGVAADTDLLLADNFARAAARQRIQQIVTLGSLLPEEASDQSPYLRSRREVELTLGSWGVPTTVLRAGIIIGPGGTSFQTIVKLVERLPIMLCPNWALSRTQPISLVDTLRFIHRCLGQEEHFGQVYDIGGPEVTTYLDMLKTTARLLGKRRLIYPLPLRLPRLSKLWTAWFADLSTTLAAPLVEGLRQDLFVRPNPLLLGAELTGSFEAMAQTALSQTDAVPPLPDVPDAEQRDLERNTVRSVQRLPNPGNRSAVWVARRYQTWLPRLFRYIIKVEQREETSIFRIGPFELLHLQFIQDRSDDSRQLFYIVGGRLAKRRDHGWLEFRRVLGGRYVMAAIHEFVPTLPWYIYTVSQALAHLWVMDRFGRYLGASEE